VDAPRLPPKRVAPWPANVEPPRGYAAAVAGGISQAGLWAGTSPSKWDRGKGRSWLLSARCLDNNGVKDMRANSEAELFALCTAALLRGDIQPFRKDHDD
jgi:hypothetical protein